MVASLVEETQLEKDVANNAGVIPIWPWLDDDKKPKDGRPPDIYANMLLQAKRQNGQPGVIERCAHDLCEDTQGIGTKSIYWRSNTTSRNIVPEGWTSFGGPDPYIYCASCRARDIEDIGLDEDLEYGREDINLKHGSTGSTGASDKPVRQLTVSLPRPTITNTERRTIMKSKESKVKQRARELYKKYPEHLRAVLKEIDKEESKKRANAAESRKRKKEDQKYYEKRKKTGGKRRRKKRTKKRRKKKTKKRRKKRRRCKKKTKRRR